MNNTLVDDLIDIVAKNGTMLLNIGPKSDGTIRPDQANILKEMGAWLAINGDAIYGTRAWKTFGEGPTESEDGYFSETKKQDAFVSEDNRFTAKNGKLYAVAMEWPKNGKASIKSLIKGSSHCKHDIKAVKMIGSSESIQWTQDQNGLNVTFPSKRPSKYAHVFEIDFGKNGKEATENNISTK